MQEVLHWQTLTIRMMYLIVGQVRPSPLPGAIRSNAWHC